MTHDWEVPTTHFAKAKELMAKFAPKLRERDFAPPTKRYPFAGAPIVAPSNKPDIKLDGTGGLPKFHPILTTDFFEFGTSTNKLEQGCAVEMGDAVLGLVCTEMTTPPKWLSSATCPTRRLTASCRPSPPGPTCRLTRPFGTTRNTATGPA